jgi:hypothetical protein
MQVSDTIRTPFKSKADLLLGDKIRCKGETTWGTITRINKTSVTVDYWGDSYRVTSDLIEEVQRNKAVTTATATPTSATDAPSSMDDAFAVGRIVRFNSSLGEDDDFNNIYGFKATRLWVCHKVFRALGLVVIVPLNPPDDFYSDEMDYPQVHYSRLELLPQVRVQ